MEALYDLIEKNNIPDTIRSQITCGNFLKLFGLTAAGFTIIYCRCLKSD